MEKIKLSIDFSREFYNKLKEKSKSKGMPMTVYIRYAISEFWEMKGE